MLKLRVKNCFKYSFSLRYKNIGVMGTLNTGEHFWARMETSLHCLHFTSIT